MREKIQNLLIKIQSGKAEYPVTMEVLQVCGELHVILEDEELK